MFLKLPSWAMCEYKNDNKDDDSYCHNGDLDRQALDVVQGLWPEPGVL